MSTISAIIITKNEANNIGECIESVLWMNEIIVVDSGSTDETAAICRKYDVKFISTDWPGFGKQKQRALDLATSDWVFSIDADERMNEKLRCEIVEVMRRDDAEIAYRIPRETLFCNQLLRHTFNPKSDMPIRLLRKGYGHFTPDLVHERIVANGKVGELKNPLQHYSFPDLEEVLNKVNFYSTLGAEKLLAKNKEVNKLKIFGHALWVFFKIYIFKGGFLDGWSGFLVAFSNFEGTFYRYAKLLERKEAQKVMQRY